MNVLYQCDLSSRYYGCPWDIGEFCLQHYSRANDVFHDKTSAVLCSVCGLFMHKLIKYLHFNLRLQQPGERVAVYS